MRFFASASSSAASASGIPGSKLSTTTSSRSSASIFVPSSCSSNATCNLESAARYGAAAGGVASFLSGLKKYADAKTHAQAFGELARSFQSEVYTQVVDVEGRSLKLTGSAEEQYREWRRLLREYQAPDAAVVPDP